MTEVLTKPRSYAAESEADHFRWWCETYLRHSVDRFAGESVLWEDWQNDWWDELLAVDPEGTDQEFAPYWRAAALVVSRKNGKTAMLAAYALYRLLNDEGKPEILLAAATDKQAGRLFEAIEDYLRRAPELREQVHMRSHVGEVVMVATGGKIIRLTSSGESLDGYNPSLVIADELHAWTTPTRKRVWTSLRTARGARLNFQMVTITTAGDAAARASSILGKMIDGNELAGDVEKPNAGLTISRNHKSRMIIFNYDAKTKDPKDWEKMKNANPASWITREFVQEQAEADDLTDADVLQLHGCVWAETETTFIGAEALASAMRDFVEIAPREAVVLGFDGSERLDETWLVAVTLDGRIEPQGRWARPTRAADDWRIPRPEVHAAVATAFKKFNVLEFAADPPGWYSEIDEWVRTYGEDKVIMFDTNQPKRFAPACDRTRKAINEGDAKFGGPLGGNLREHFANCVTRETSSGSVVNKDDPTSPRKIDGAVAAIIAFDRAMWHADNVAPTYRVAGFS